MGDWADELERRGDDELEELMREEDTRKQEMQARAAPSPVQTVVRDETRETLNLETGEVTERALVAAQPPSVPDAKVPTLPTQATLLAIAMQVARSGYFSDAREAAQAFVKMLAGSELGLSPIQSMTGIYIVEGKPTISSHTMNALILRSPRHRYQILARNETACRLLFFVDGIEVGESAFSLVDAQRAGLANRPVWQRYPRNMLFWRALSEGFRMYCADLTLGGPIYTPEELGVDVNGETGEPVAPQTYVAHVAQRMGTAQPIQLVLPQEEDEAEEAQIAEIPNLIDDD